MSSAILLVEDDEALGELLATTLRAHGQQVSWAMTAAQTLEALTPAEPPDLVLLDLGLPDLDGVELCRRLRARLPSTVIVVLSARHDEIDVVVALDAGADDYLRKPFRYAELLARLRAHLRRGRGTTGAPSSVTVGTLRLDVPARRCLLGALELALRPREFDLLACLAEHAGQVVLRENLINMVWDEHWFGSTKTLDVHIASVRRRLAVAADGAGVDPPVITTVRARGYRMDADA